MSDNIFYLKTNEAVIIRPMTFADVPFIDAMHDRVSKDSLYYRYFAVNKPPLSSLSEQAHLSSTRGEALVAVLQHQPQDIIGLAYYVCLPGDTHIAEPALLIEDRFQGQGLGWAMMERLIRAAQTNAVFSFQCYVLPDNQRIMKILEKSGLPLERHYRDGLLEVNLTVFYRVTFSPEPHHNPSNINYQTSQ